jgi:hypothetical protein
MITKRKWSRFTPNVWAALQIPVIRGRLFAMVATVFAIATAAKYHEEA